MKQLVTPSRLLLPFLLAAPAAAQSTLVLSTGAGTDDVRLEVGPGAGEVTVFGVPSVPEGTLFSGVQTVQLDTGAENDKVTVLGSLTSSLTLLLTTGTGSDQVFVQFAVPSVLSTDPILAVVDVSGDSGDDLVQYDIVNERNTFVLDTRFTGSTGSDTLDVSLNSGALTVDRQAVFIDAFLGDQADVLNVNVTSAATLALLEISDEASIENESATILWNQSPRPGVVYTTFDLLSGGPKIDLLGQNSFFVAQGRILGGILDDNITLVSEGIFVALGLVIDGGSGQDNIELLCGSNLWGNPLLAGGFGDDTLTLIVEQFQGLALGIPTVDGGPGIDKSVTPGVTAVLINIEEFA